ncbi:MAG TPA: efflux RND transporter periplasmic adaptor subunit [Blastocatellia bacterium]|nr:efflux RND transporter periplasmic adaptor subunit [Blastocatellia bacterium]
MQSLGFAKRILIRARKHRFRSGLFVFVTASLLFGVAVLLARSKQKPAFATASVSANGPSPFAEVGRGTLSKTLLVDGELRAVRSRTIFASTSDEAKITYLPPEGTLVKEGDRLVELDSTSILNKIKDNEERIIAADNDIIKTQSSHEAALKEMDVALSNLWLAFEEAKIKARVPDGLLPRRDYQERQLALSKAQTEYETQLAKIEKKKKEQEAEIQNKTIEKEKLAVQLSRAKNELSGVNVRAPSEGMVIYADHWFERRKLQVGDVVWGGFPLVRLPDLKEMEVISQINEVDGPKVSLGQRARIALDSYPGTEITGSVQDISQTAVRAGWMAKSKVFKVVLKVDKTLPEIMKPGMSAQVWIALAAQSEQILVPRPAVRFEGESATVLRVEGDQQRPVAVTILGADSTNYAIADNGVIKTGDRIVSKQQ